MKKKRIKNRQLSALNYTFLLLEKKRRERLDFWPGIVFENLMNRHYFLNFFFFLNYSKFLFFGFINCSSHLHLLSIKL